MWNCSACLTIQQAFSKPCLLNLITNDTHLVFSICSISSLTREKERETCPEVIKLFSCSTHLSMEVQMLIKSKMLKNKAVLGFQMLLSDVLLMMLINIKMPTIVGILTFISRINMHRLVEHEKCFITSGPGC